MKQNIYIYSPVKDTVDLFLSSTIDNIFKLNHNLFVLSNPLLSINYTNNIYKYKNINIVGNNTQPLSIFNDINIIKNIRDADVFVSNGSATIITSLIYKILYPLKNNIYIMHGTLKSKGLFYNNIFLILLFLSNLFGIKVYYVNKKFIKYFPRKKLTKFLGLAGVGVHQDEVNILFKSRILQKKSIKTYTIAFIGRHEASKGFNLFIDIAKNNINHNLRFISIGGEIQNSIKDNIIMYGKLKRNDLFLFLKDIDILIMPSFSEGIGMAMVECCIAGIPTIASSTDGSNQFIKHNYNGKIINSRDPLIYLNAIEDLINNYDLYSKNCIEYSEINNNFISNPITFI